MKSIDADEVERRLPIWHALSDLFLDTELQDADYRFIVRKLSESDFDAAELKRILDEEVGPAFAFNLTDPAGVWTRWHEEDVRRIVLEYIQRGPFVPVKWDILRKVIAAEWGRLAPLISND